jgi:hypothetical protein
MPKTVEKLVDKFESNRYGKPLPDDDKIKLITMIKKFVKKKVKKPALDIVSGGIAGGPLFAAPARFVPSTRTPAPKPQLPKKAAKKTAKKK